METDRPSPGPGGPPLKTAHLQIRAVDGEWVTILTNVNAMPESFLFDYASAMTAGFDRRYPRLGHDLRPRLRIVTDDD